MLGRMYPLGAPRCGAAHALTVVVNALEETCMSTDVTKTSAINMQNENSARTAKTSRWGASHRVIIPPGSIA